jgi:hypothetical protein
MQHGSVDPLAAVGKLIIGVERNSKPTEVWTVVPV